MYKTYLVHVLLVVGVELLLHGVLSHAGLVLLGSLNGCGAGGTVSAVLVSGRGAVAGVGLLTGAGGGGGDLSGGLNGSSQSTGCSLLACTGFLLGVGLLLHSVGVGVEAESGGLRAVGGSVSVSVVLLSGGDTESEVGRLLGLHVLAVVLLLTLVMLSLSLSSRGLRGG